MAENPKLITYPFADEDTTKTTDFQAEPTTLDPDTLVTQKYGWKQVYSTPLDAGGAAPERDDMNGLFNWITTLLFRTQKGWLWKYDATQSYLTPALVWDNNEIYLCTKDVAVGDTFHKPSTDIEYANWMPLKVYFKQNIPVNDGVVEFWQRIQSATGNSDTKLGDFSANSGNNKAIYVPIGNGKITFKSNGESIGSFTTNQNSDSDIDIPYVNNGKLTINSQVNANGSINTTQLGTFTANQSDNSTINVPVGNGTITLSFAGQVLGSFTANQSSNANFDLLTLCGAAQPIGAVTAWAGMSTTPPPGWLFCDGDEYSKTDYASLFEIIGYTYGGSGDKFKVPNLQEKFIQGASSTNSSYTVGTTKFSGLPNITGTMGGLIQWSSQGKGAFKVENPERWHTDAEGDYDTTGGAVTFDAERGRKAWYKTKYSKEDTNTVYGTTDIVQPPSVVLRYIIRYI